MDPREVSKAAIARAALALETAIAKERAACLSRQVQEARAALQIEKLTKSLNRAKFDLESFEAIGNADKLAEVRRKYDGQM